MAPLTLVPIYFSSRSTLLKSLAESLERTFQLAVRIRPPWFDPELSFDSSRGQYNSTHILTQLLDEPSGDEARILAVTSVDLFIPVLTFVFGEAQLDGRAAVVSIQRLRSEAYGLPANEPLLRERLEKEAVHELGHTFGLLHCIKPKCVMNSSTYVEQIDTKSPHFCAACLELVTATKA